MLTRRSSARDLATRAYEMGTAVLRGELARQDPDNWAVDGQSVTEWLAGYEGQQVYLIAIAVNAQSTPTVVRRTCRTCGRDYQGSECPYCHEARLRLRGDEEGVLALCRCFSSLCLPPVGFGGTMPNLPEHPPTGCHLIASKKDRGERDA